MLNSSANATLTELLNQVIGQDAEQYGNLTFVQLLPTLGFLPINPSLINIPIIAPSIETFFSEDKFALPQVCAYAISGQYGFLNRLLFYCLLLFSLIIRKKLWLCGAALGVAMTYSCCAAVHAFALFVRYRYHSIFDHPHDWMRHLDQPEWFGDIDLAGIFPILSAGAIMVTPLLIWSEVLRSKEARGLRPVVVLWGVIIISALIPSVVYTVKGVTPFMVPFHVSLCQTDVSKGCTFDALHKENYAFYSKDMYRKCQCVDTCADISMENIPFRKYSTLQALLFDDQTANLETSDESIFSSIETVNTGFLCFIIFQCVVALVAYQSNPDHVRNKLFLWLAGISDCDVWGLDGSRSDLIRTCRYYSAEFLAGSGYFLALLVFVVSPFVFISSVVINEITVSVWPSENYDAVGQWSPWVAAAFAIVAACMEEAVQRYGLPGLRLVKPHRSHTTKVIIGDWRDMFRHPSYQHSNIFSAFWAWLKDPVAGSRHGLEYERSLARSENEQYKDLVDAPAKGCSECERRYCSADRVQQEPYPTPTGTAMASLDPHSSNRKDTFKAHSPSQISLMSEAGTMPIIAQAETLRNGLHVGSPRPGVSMRPSFPRNTIDDSARPYTLPTFSLSHERLLPIPLGSSPPSQHSREPTPSPPSTPRLTASMFE